MAGWRRAAPSASTAPPSIAHRTNYSPCKICNQPGQRTPLWQVKAERVVYDQVKHHIRFHRRHRRCPGRAGGLDADLHRCPIPRCAMPAGFLTPEVGNSTKIGYFTRLPDLYLDLATART